jgi:tetratricopeptide (TPR) repeat protein
MESNRRAICAHALHQAGELYKAIELFLEAETMQKQDFYKQPPILYSTRGYYYCDCLLSRGEVADVQKRASKTLELSTQFHSLLDMGLDNLSLGVAALSLGETDSARQRLNTAVDWLRSSGYNDNLCVSLLARASLFRMTGDLASAEEDLNEVLDMANRSGFRLVVTDCLLERARLALVQRQVRTALQLIGEAKDLIQATGYKRRIPDLNLLSAAAGLQDGNPVMAEKHLREVARLVAEGWNCHRPKLVELWEKLPKTSY